MVQRFYIDTSVIGGVFDTEFEEHSTILFEKIKIGEIKAVISPVTENEISKARKEIRDFFKSLPKNCVEYVEITNDAVQLADTYISDKVVGKTNRDDCLHIGLALFIKWIFWLVGTSNISLTFIV